jgi:hypothetical protein
MISPVDERECLSIERLTNERYFQINKRILLFGGSIDPGPALPSEGFIAS